MFWPAYRMKIGVKQRMKRTIRSQDQLIQNVRDLEKSLKDLPAPTGSMMEVLSSPYTKVWDQIRLLKKQLLRQYHFRFPGDKDNYEDWPTDSKESRGPIE